MTNNDIDIYRTAVEKVGFDLIKIYIFFLEYCSTKYFLFTRHKNAADGLSSPGHANSITVYSPISGMDTFHRHAYALSNAPSNLLQDLFTFVIISVPIVIGFQNLYFSTDCIFVFFHRLHFCIFLYCWINEFVFSSSC